MYTNMPIISLKTFLPILYVIPLENIHSMQKAPRTFELTSCLSGKEDKWWRARKETPSFSIETTPPWTSLSFYPSCSVFITDLFLFSRIVILDPICTLFWIACLSLSLNKLNRSKFCCLLVSLWGIGNSWLNLRFFQYRQAQKPFTDHAPPSTKQYQLIMTQYHQVVASIT